MRFQAGQCRNIFNINDARCRPCAGYRRDCPKHTPENHTDKNGGNDHGKESGNRPV